MLKGGRVLLRPLKKDDIKLFQTWLNNLEVVKYFISYLPVTEYSSAQWINAVIEGRQPTFIIETIESGDNGEGKAIGYCGLRDVDHKDGKANLQIVIGDEENWGKGYGYEAARLLINYGFDYLNLHKINSSAYVPNKRSISLHEKLSFVKEGIRRQDAFSDGEWRDLILYGLLREEWKKQKITSGPK